MTTSLRSLAIFTLLTAAALPAGAKDSLPGPYIGISGGANFQNNAFNFNDASSSPPFDTTAVVSFDTDTGFNVGLIGGYRFGSWGTVSPRFEVETGYLANNADSSNSTIITSVIGIPFLTTIGTNDATIGEVNAHYALASLLFDIPLNGPVMPFIGGGVGFANVSFDNIIIQSGANTGVLIANDEDTVFAWNVTAGFSYNLSRNIALALSYRYLRFEGIDALSTAAGGGTINSNDVENHQVNLGFRFELN